MRSTGEEDRRAAQAKVPFLVAEYERLVAEARASLANTPGRKLTNVEAHRMAARFYRDMLPFYTASRPLAFEDHLQAVADINRRLAAARAMFGRNDFTPVVSVARMLVKQAKLSIPDGASEWEMLHRLLMKAYVELHEVAAANLAKNPAVICSDWIPSETSAVC